MEKKASQISSSYDSPDLGAMKRDLNPKPHEPSSPVHAFSSSAGILTSLMLLHRPPHPNLLRHLLIRRHLAVAADSDCLAAPTAGDPWIAKAVSTAFLLSPSTAAARLAPIRGLLTPSVAFEAIRRLPDPTSAVQLFELTRSDFQIVHLAAAHCFLVEFLSKSGLHEAALKVFDQMTGEGHSPDSSFLQLLVESLAEAGQLDAAMGLLARASEFECRVQPYTLNKLMSLLIARNRARDAIRFFKEQSVTEPSVGDTYSFNIIIKGLFRLGEVDEAFVYFRQMRDLGCLPDTVTYNIFVDGLCKADKVDRAHEMLKETPLPNVVTYTSIISGYCRMGKMEEAFCIFSEMIGLGIRPSRVTYNVLIDGYGKAGDMQSAVLVYNRMVVCECPPDVVTLTSLIDGYCRSGQLQEAMEFWHQMSERGLRPNVYTFAIVINAFCKKNRVDEARDLVKELNRRKDILPQAFVYNPVIDGFCKAGNVDEANSILMEMEDRRCSPDKFTYTILIIGHCMKGRMSDAIAIFDKMLASGCAPDMITFSSLVSCLLKAGMPNEANHIMLIASKKDFRLEVPSLRQTPLSSRNNLNISVAA